MRLYEAVSMRDHEAMRMEPNGNRIEARGYGSPRVGRATYVYLPSVGLFNLHFMVTIRPQPGNTAKPWQLTDKHSGIYELTDRDLDAIEAASDELCNIVNRMRANANSQGMPNGDD